jgi:beta-galactosidase
MRLTFALVFLAAPALAEPLHPVREARVETANGMPRLLVNGRPVAPLMFFPNTDIPGEWSKTFLREQVTLAAGAGVHLYSFPYRVSRKNDGSEPDYAHADRCVEAILEADPDAVFLLRIYPGPWPFWKEWADIPETEITRFADGSSNFISFASEHFKRHFAEDLAQIIRRVEASPHGDRVIGYQPGGPEHEMFMDHYREKGPDYSQANTLGFRKWLAGMYADDAALQRAWAREEVTLGTANVPAFEPGRFPMHGAREGETVEVFYSLPEEQDWLDYSRYVSDANADLIVSWAEIVKRETDRKKLSAFFYGYTFELIGSFNGHDRLSRVLDCPDVDILASPYSYMGRLGGDPGGFMSPADSVAARGKLWFNEDDSRTSVLHEDKVGNWNGLWAGGKAETLDETVGMLGRNLGTVMTHRAGTWWMDLLGAGAFASPDLWQVMADRAPRFRELAADPAPFRPEAAVIVDEYSKGVVKSDWDVHFRLMAGTRNASMLSGASVGFYTLDDFIDGVVPPCKAYVLTNLFDVTDGQAALIRERLDREGATALWLYAPGCMGANGADLSGAERLTGIRMTADTGVQGSEGAGPWAGTSWGWTANVSPRPVVDDPDAEVLGRYRSDGAVSAARKRVGSHTSVVAADLSVDHNLLRRVFEEAGAHIWTRGGESVQTDGTWLIIHRKEADPVRVALPEGVKAEPSGGTVADSDASSITLEFSPFETVWLRLGR